MYEWNKFMSDSDIEEDRENTILPLLVGLLAAFTVGYWVLSGDPSEAASASHKTVAQSASPQAAR